MPAGSPGVSTMVGASLTMGDPVACGRFSYLAAWFDLHGGASYRVPGPRTEKAAPFAGIRSGGLTRYELWGSILSGCVWCFYNLAFILPLSFGPGMLTAGGMKLAAAGAVVSLASWLIIPALPLGGWLAERLGHPVATLTVSFVVIAALLWMIPETSHDVLMFAALGVIFGPAGGLIMALPAQVLQARNRAVGMGIYFTVYYVGMGVGPSIAGYARDISGNPAAPLWLAGLMSLLALSAFLAFRGLLSLRERVAG